MADQVPEDVKRERIERLIEVVQRVAEARNQERIGRVEEVLVEKSSPDGRLAATRADAPQHDRRLRRDRLGGRARAGHCRGSNLDHSQRHAASSRCRLRRATSSGTAVSTSATWAACRRATEARRAAARWFAPTASGCSATTGGARSSTTGSDSSSTCAATTSARRTRPPSCQSRSSTFLPWRRATRSGRRSPLSSRRPPRQRPMTRRRRATRT